MKRMMAMALTIAVLLIVLVIITPTRKSGDGVPTPFPPTFTWQANTWIRFQANPRLTIKNEKAQFFVVEGFHQDCFWITTSVSGSGNSFPICKLGEKIVVEGMEVTLFLSDTSSTYRKGYMLEIFTTGEWDIVPE